MFEGGHQSNIFDKTLGSVKQDKNIKEKKSELENTMKEISKINEEKCDLENKLKKCKADMITKETEVRLREENVSS